MRAWRLAFLSLCLIAIIGSRPVLALDQPASNAGSFPGVHVGPITDSSQLRWYFGESGYSVLDHADFAFQRDRAALYTELYSDYVYPFRLLGYVRTGLGVFIQSGEDTVVAANERMFNAGGNACVFFGLPLLSYASYIGQKEQGRLTVTLSPRVGVDVPAMGARVEHPTFSLDLSADIETRMRTFSDALQVFGALRYGRRSGSPFFYDHLGHGGQGAFFLGTFKVGVIIASIFQISVTRTFLAPEEMRAAIQPTLMVRFSSRKSP